MATLDEDELEVAARMMEERKWPFTLKLSYPVEFGKDTIEELVFQRGKMGHTTGISLDRTPTFSECMLLASRLCGKPLKVIESLDPEDSAEVVSIALGFFARCLGAGKKRSGS